MIEVKIEGVEQMKRKLEVFGKALNKESGEIIKEIARNGAKSAATTTFPRGIASNTRDTLTKAIYKDIIRAYQPSGTSTVVDDGDYMYSNRNAKGRVSSNTKRKFISQASYENIRKEKIKLAGMAKAGWMAGSNSIGAKKINVPVWLRKDYSFLGSSTVTGNGWETTVEVNNNVKYASSLLTDSQLRKIISYSYINYMSYTERVMQKLADKV